jgi:hypothetical protein
MNGAVDAVKAACAANYDAWKGDCSGFAKAVAAALGVQLAGMANDIVNTLRAADGIWTPLANGPAAAAAAAGGLLVLAGLRGDELAAPQVHGHVVVVVKGAPLNRDLYPFAYWGSLGAQPGYDQTINWAWTLDDLPKVSYASTPIVAG